MFELSKTKEVARLIEITKSNSGISGPKLASAHIELGRYLARHIPFPPNDTTVIAVLRGGIFFAQGIYFELGCKFQLYDPKHEAFRRPETTYVIVVDSVINTGKTLFSMLDQDVYFASCVINENALPLFEDKLFTVRVSRNSFVGSCVKKQSGKLGPDTTMRLFNDI